MCGLCYRLAPQVYQRAVITPMINIETLWKEYTVFEQGINPMIAEKLTQVPLLTPLSISSGPRSGAVTT